MPASRRKPLAELHGSARDCQSRFPQVLRTDDRGPNHAKAPTDPSVARIPCAPPDALVPRRHCGARAHRAAAADARIRWQDRPDLQGFDAGLDPSHAPEGPGRCPEHPLDRARRRGLRALGELRRTHRDPNLDRLAGEGLRYTNFHTTALCSPSRGALLTGRNHHSIGLAAITEAATGYPGNYGNMPKSAATVAEVLKQNGYNTFAVGKWHLAPIPPTPRPVLSTAGPWEWGSRSSTASWAERPTSGHRSWSKTTSSSMRRAGGLSPDRRPGGSHHRLHP